MTNPILFSAGFSSIAGDNNQFYTMAADGSGVTPLVISADKDWAWGVWSPDGSKILAFDDNANNLWVLNADGSTLLELTVPNNTGDSYGFQGTWSPDGTRVAVVTDATVGGGLDIAVIHADNSSSVLLGLTDIYGPNAGYSISWSPDGTKIVYQGPSYHSVNTIAPDGTGHAVLIATDTTHTYYPMQWYSDSANILIARADSSGTDIIKTDGTTTTVLYHDPASPSPSYFNPIASLMCLSDDDTVVAGLIENGGAGGSIWTLAGGVPTTIYTQASPSYLYRTISWLGVPPGVQFVAQAEAMSSASISKISFNYLAPAARAKTGIAVILDVPIILPSGPLIISRAAPRGPTYEWILIEKPKTVLNLDPAIITQWQNAQAELLLGAEIGTGTGTIAGIMSNVWPSMFVDQPLTKVGELTEAHSRQFQLVANRAGSASFVLRTNDDMMPKILDGVDFNDVRGTVKHGIRIRRNKVDLWSGLIWGINGDLDQGQLTFNCVGWLETLQNRVMWNAADYSNNGYGTRPDLIAFDILGREALQDLNHPPLVMPGSVAGTLVIRDRFYQRGQNVGAALQELSDVEDGFDYVVDPVTRRMNLQDPNIYTVQRDVKFGYNWGPSNLLNVQWQEDASKTCNYMSIQSQGAPVVVEDSTAINEYGLFEENNTLTGANQDILAPYGMAELAIRSRPLIVYTLLPAPTGPRLFDDFNIRDEIFFTAVKDHFKVQNQGIRVFGATVQLDDNDNETVTALQTAPSTS